MIIHKENEIDKQVSNNNRLFVIFSHLSKFFETKMVPSFKSMNWIKFKCAIGHSAVGITDQIQLCNVTHMSGREISYLLLDGGYVPVTCVWTGRICGNSLKSYKTNNSISILNKFVSYFLWIYAFGKGMNSPFLPVIGKIAGLSTYSNWQQV